MVDSVYGIPAAAAARATPTSANGQPNPMPPVGPTAMGRLARAPRIAAEVSMCSTPVSIFGAMRTRSKAARFSRSVISSSAAPSKKSNIARGRRRFAIPRKSSMFQARRTRAEARRDPGQDETAGAETSAAALRSPLAALIRLLLRRS